MSTAGPLSAEGRRDVGPPPCPELPGRPELRLRPFRAADAEAVQRLAGDPVLARMTTRLPHPYRLLDAQMWIATHAAAWRDGTAVNWAIVSSEADVLHGCIGLELDARDALGTLGYWVGRPFWGRGIASAAAAAVVHWALGAGVQKIAATCLADNGASLAVLRRAGLQQEGRLVQHARRDGARVDVLCLGRLRGARAPAPDVP